MHNRRTYKNWATSYWQLNNYEYKIALWQTYTNYWETFSQPVLSPICQPSTVDRPGMASSAPLLSRSLGWDGNLASRQIGSSASSAPFYHEVEGLASRQIGSSASSSPLLSRSLGWGLPGAVIWRAGLLTLEWQSLEESDVVTVQRRWAIGPLR